MKRNVSFSYILWLLIVSILILSSCNLPNNEPELDLAMVVAQTQTAISINQLLTSTASVSQTDPTATVEPPKTLTPTYTIDITPCDDKVSYIGETIPDGSKFSPGESFQKEWKLRNDGSCTWTSEYSLVFDHGDKLGEIDTVTLSENVNPGEELVIQVPLFAPDSPGDYQGFWMLQNKVGEKFGLGDQSDVAFWVKIEVSDPGQVLNLGAPTWTQNFEGETAPWFLGPGEDISFDLEDDKLVMTAFEPAGDQWRVAQVGFLDDFYLEAEFETGSSCQAKDSYGLLVRAPDQPDNIIDSGYVFVISCDGQYRVYMMINGQYNGIVNWQSSPSISNGPNQKNRVGIKVVDDDFQLFINDQLVTEFKESTYQTGYFGLSVRSESTLDFQAFVNRISYWLLD